jgi:hypothetical protein
MTAAEKKMVSKTCLIAYAVMLALSTILATGPGGFVEWFAVMGLFAVPAIVVGSKRYRIIGTIALVIAIGLTATDYHIRRARERMREEEWKQYQKESVEPSVKGTEGVKVTGQ